MKNIALIIPNYNQSTYLINLIIWWMWYNPGSMVYVIDNKSNETSCYNFLQKLYPTNILVWFAEENNCVNNLKELLKSFPHDYYVISDPDIMPHPSTPPNFLEIFKHCIDHYGFDHVGFGLITSDIPDWNGQKRFILDNEKSFSESPFEVDFGGRILVGNKAPIDTTFAMYKKANGGWTSPMPGDKWSNSLRLFSAFHLPWYLHPNFINLEMKNYFDSCIKSKQGVCPTGQNNYRPTGVGRVREVLYNDVVNKHDLRGEMENNRFKGFLEDYHVLVCLLKKHKPKTIFEIGTNTGYGTRMMKHACPYATVFSLDLPFDEIDKSLQHPGHAVGHECNLEYVQLLCDSLKFDYTQYPCECAFIDGEHDHKHVYHETTEILRWKPNLIIYHDADIAGVYLGIMDAFAGNDEYDLVRVTDTRILYALKK